MNAGMLRNKITIQKKNITTDDIGQQIANWSDYFNCYAYANGLSGTEYWTAAQQNAENTVVFTIRYSSKSSVINPIAYRIIFNSKIYDISNVDNIQFRNETLKIRATVKEV